MINPRELCSQQTRHPLSRIQSPYEVLTISHNANFVMPQGDSMTNSLAKALADAATPLPLKSLNIRNRWF